MKKALIFVSIIEAIIIVCLILLSVCPSVADPDVKKADLAAFISQFSEENNCVPDTGYIPDAETARIIGSEIIDDLTGNHHRFGGTTVTYDEENRLWLVEKGYLFYTGGFVVLEQDSGKVLKALLHKG